MDANKKATGGSPEWPPMKTTFFQQPMKTRSVRPVTGAQLALTLALWTGASASLAAATYFALPRWAPIWTTSDHIAIAIASEVYFLFLVAACIVFGRIKGLGEHLNFKFTGARDIYFALRWYAIGLCSCLVIYFLLSPVIGPLPNTLFQVLRHASDLSRLSSAGIMAWFLIILRACILAPLAEELLFRGLLFSWLRSYFGAAITILLTTLIFTGMHYYPILYPVAIIFGLISAWVRERTGSSMNFVFAHMFNSILLLAIAYALVSARPAL